MEDSLLIRKVDADTVRRLCTGQVIGSMAGACKELIENALDAGAKLIEIRVDNFGADQLEVSDNGKGVPKKDTEFLCQAHTTSKLENIEGLSRLSSYGFRGEALHALAAISLVSITTRYVGEEVGCALEFDGRGQIVKRRSLARQPGTTVKVSNLFDPLPVRRKSLLKSLNKEWKSLFNLVQSYAIVCEGVRFMLKKWSGDPARTLLLSTEGKSLQENAAKVLKGTTGLVPLETKFPTPEQLEEWGVPRDEIAAGQQESIAVTGLLSSPKWGSGGVSSFHQFFFVNCRPLDHEKLRKLVMDTYRQNSSSRVQSPAIVLSITIPSYWMDVNVSPDKRQAFLSNERYVLAVVKASVISFLDEEAKKCPTIGKISTELPAKSSKSNVLKTPPSKRELRLMEYYHPSERNEGEKAKPAARDTTPNPSEPRRKMRLEQFVELPDEGESPTGFVDGNVEDGNVEDGGGREVKGSRTITHGKENIVVNIGKEKAESNALKTPPSKRDLCLMEYYHPSEKNEGEKAKAAAPKKTPNPSEPRRKMRLEQFVELPDEGESPTGFVDGNVEDGNVEDGGGREVKGSRTIASKQRNGMWRKKRNISFNVEKLRERMEAVGKEEKETGKKGPFQFRLEPFREEEAASELSRKLTKTDFTKMEVLGQFNLGFIIVRLGDDLFVVDQHASDEKFKFEQYRNSLEVDTQALIAPRELNLDPVSESVIIDNLPIFAKNGYRFQIDEEGPSGKKVKMAGFPVIGKVNFEQDDLMELINLLGEYPGMMHRPQRIRKFLASKACRAAYMIGTHLKMYEMNRIVAHLADLEHPWNCPHGRPTLRHLLDLNHPTLNGPSDGAMAMLELRSRSGGNKDQESVAESSESSGVSCVDRQLQEGDTLQKIALQY